MGKFIAVLVVVGAIVGALWWWVHRPQTSQLTAARADVAQLQANASRDADRLRTLETQVADLQSVRAELQKSSTELQQKVQEKETELAALRGTQDELVSGLKKEIESQQVQVQRIRDQLRVDVVDELLFDSGEAELKPAGQAVLAKVGNILEKTEDRTIEVQGHTDNVPIVGALAKKYPTNWELSAARAVNVARFLQQNGVEPARLSAAAHSEYRPRSANDSDDGRRKNRRIEILLGSKVAPQAAAAAPSAASTP
jgi:chemotaxis protein MotB